jgi:hypothetical protein
MAITHGQKWFVDNAVTINGNLTNEPLSGCQWYQKALFGKRIAPGNPDFADMSWGRTQPMTNWTEGNKVVEGGPTQNNNQPSMVAV